MSWLEKILPSIGKNAKKNNNKKNIYYTANEAIDRLVDALKYAARNM